MSDPRTCVTFKSSAFNTTQQKDYFINPCCFGDDVAKWLTQELKDRNISVDKEPDQEDFGWYIRFLFDNVSYNLVIVWIPEEEDEEGCWMCVIERAGMLTAILGRRGRVATEVIKLFHDVLVSSDKMENVLWHFEKQFQTQSGNGVTDPFGV